MNPMKQPFLTRLSTLWFGSLLGRKWWIVLLLVGAAALRLGGMHKGFWIDEAWSVEWNRPLAERRATQIYSAGPVHQYETCFWVYRLGNRLARTGSVAMVRAPILLIGLLAIWLGWRLGRLWRWWMLGYLLALALTVWPFKAYWDTTYRHYAIMICLFLAMVLTWEAWRLRPSFRRYLAALVVTGLAALTHEISIILVIVPPIYLFWGALARLTHDLARRRRAWRPSWRAPLALAGQLLLFGYVALFLIHVNRGPDWTLKRLRKTLSTTVAGAQAAPEEKANPIDATNDTVQIREPKLADAVQYTQSAFRSSFNPKQLNPWRLFSGTWARSTTLGSFFVLSYDSEGQRHWHHGDALNLIVAIGLVLGSLVVLIISPPLLLALWSCLLLTGLLISLNQDQHFMDPRYYTYPYLIVLILVVVALAFVARLVVLPIHRFRPRLGAYATLGMAIAAGVAAFALEGGPARRAAAFTYNNFEDVYTKAMKEHVPENALITGDNPICFKMINELEAAGDHLHRADNFWRQAGRNGFFDVGVYYSSKDFAYLDYLNSYSAILFFYPFRVKPSEFPLLQFKDLFAGFKTASFQTCAPAIDVKVWAEVYDLKNRLFITRGRATLPLMPRLKHGGSAAAEYALSVYYETPGQYELTIGQTPAGRLLKVRIDGRPVPFETRALPRGDTTGERLAPIFRKEGRDNPIFMQATAQYVLHYQSPQVPMTPHAIELTFDRPVDAQVPVLEWTCQARKWKPGNEFFDLGDLQTYNTADGFYIGSTVRMKRIIGDDMVVGEVVLRDPARMKEKLVRLRSYFILPMRQVATGDVLPFSPIKIDRALADKLAGKTLVVTALAARGNMYAVKPNWRLPPWLKPSQGSTSSDYLLCYVMFVKKDGKLGMQLGFPKS